MKKYKQIFAVEIKVMNKTARERFKKKVDFYGMSVTYSMSKLEMDIYKSIYGRDKKYRSAVSKLGWMTRRINKLI